jgi:V-type H+-transporting ATPase subunit a
MKHTVQVVEFVPRLPNTVRMGNFFRSEEMALCQLILKRGDAYTRLSELGELALVQFRDLNTGMITSRRNFVSEVRQCDEMESKLRYLVNEIKEIGIPIPDSGEIPAAPEPGEVNDLEATIEEVYDEVREVVQNAEVLKQDYLPLKELKLILTKPSIFYEYEGGVSMIRVSDESISSQTPTDPLKFWFVVGVILRERIPAFERMLWRASRGNVFLQHEDLKHPCDKDVLKSVFIIFSRGHKLGTLVMKICGYFRATLYPCPEAAADREELAVDAATRLEDLKIVLSKNRDYRYQILFAAANKIKIWFVKVRKMKAIYHTLNMFNLNASQNCMVAELWVPVLDLETVKLALISGNERSSSLAPTILNRMESIEVPPTYNRTNKFTYGFQVLIDAYGVATYKEVNPAPYTMVTFPFLFAVMFGDLGHGLLMALFAGWMVLREKSLAAKKSDNEFWNILFGGRYVILFMGLYSMYTGFVYNDVFSKSLNIFGSYWAVNYNMSTITSNKNLQLNPSSKDYYQHPYPVGMDPVWQVAENKIVFMNSYKMKISIIFGVFHMLFGVCLSLWNFTYFRKRINIYCEFIPRIIFMCSLFLYLVILMFFKWTNYGPCTGDEKTGSYCAPSVLITFINILLFRENTAPEECDKYMYDGQREFQMFLVLVAFVCIMWMLLAKPVLFLINQRKKHIPSNSNHQNHATAEASLDQDQSPPPNNEEEEHGLGDLLIEQAIHTIEYVLGCVSQTASYLRLWALSLAHAQLSEVVWNMVLRNGLMFDSWVGGFFLWMTFSLWATFTVAILILMEGLSAFLHTLRLHWVEFQSKFYQGMGYAFRPFSFEAILDFPA